MSIEISTVPIYIENPEIDIGAYTHLSADGSVVASFKPTSNKVRIYNTNTQTLIGNEIVSPNVNGIEVPISSIFLSKDGLSIAIGLKKYSVSPTIKTGAIKVYDYDGNDWVLRGGYPLIGCTSKYGISYGEKVFLSDNKNIVIGTGKDLFDSSSAYSYFFNYIWNGNFWLSDNSSCIYSGPNDNYTFGDSMYSNSTGNITVVSDPGVDKVYVYIKESTLVSWTQYGTEISIPGVNAVSMNSSGDTIYIAGNNIVKVYKYTTDWIQEGSDYIISTGNVYSLSYNSTDNMLLIGSGASSTQVFYADFLDLTNQTIIKSYDTRTQRTITNSENIWLADGSKIFSTSSYDTTAINSFIEVLTFNTSIPISSNKKRKKRENSKIPFLLIISVGLFISILAALISSI